MRFLTAVVAAVATLSGDADAALSPGYWCQRRVDGDGEPIGHRGVCGRRNACQESGTKMVMSNLCNKLPSWSVCCLETPTEPAMEWENGDSAEYNADITKDQLKCCMRIHNFRFTDSLANETYEPVKEAMRFGNIKSKYQVSAFLAQVGAESGSLQWFRELGNSNCGGYDGGCRYKGRGPIQLTHRYNYRKAQSWLRENNLISSSQDIVRNPELAETKRIGFLTTVWFWTVSARLNTLSNTNKYQDFFKLSRKINGGLRGINHRVDRWRHCAQCMGANVMPEIDMSGNGAPAPVGEGGSHGGSQDGRDSSIAALGSDHGNFSKDSECGAIGGTCMESRHCTGASFYHATVSSKCGGGATRTCCVTKCRKNRDGECGTPSSCSGSTVSGQCPGRFDKCCPGVAPGELLQLSTGSLLQTSAAEAPAVEIPIEPTQVRDNKRTEEGGSAHVRQAASAIVSRLMANPAQFVAQVVEALKTKVREGLVPAEELYNLVEAGAMEGVMDTYNFWTNRLEDEEEIANKCVTSIESLKDLSTSATLLDELKSFDKNNLSAESSSFLAPDVHATESGENNDAPAHKAVPEVDDSAVLAEAAGPQ